MLLEKAFAKVFGNYKQLETKETECGSLPWVMTDLTGCPTEVIDLDDAAEQFLSDSIDERADQVNEDLEFLKTKIDIYNLLGYLMNA
jgi:hypothetical protein